MIIFKAVSEANLTEEVSLHCPDWCQALEEKDFLLEAQMVLMGV